MMSHIENIHIVGLALCFTTLTRKTRNAQLQAMNAMAGFWAACIFTTRKNKPLKHGTGGLTMAEYIEREGRADPVPGAVSKREKDQIREVTYEP